MKTNYLKSLLLVLLSLPFAMAAQVNVQMSDGLFYSCGGALLDSGGQGGPGYSNDENFTFTICPETEGDVVTVDFITFNLDQSGNQNTWDYMAIYDGDGTNATPLGTYTGDALEGLFVTATSQNTSGCLTFVFDSNGTGTGNIGGAITCDTPCDRPVAEATYDAPVSHRICVDEVINFDGTASSAAPGFSLVNTTWDFADGTTDDSGLLVSHSWSEPGEYIVELFLEDDNGCASTNRVSLQVLVATYPSWIPFPGDQTLCLGELIELSADPELYEVTWAGPDVTYSNSDNIELSDDVGFPFTSDIEVAGFAPGQTITSITDLVNVGVDINHSFLFDLVIIVTCPSGESAILHQQMQQPGGADVGSNGTDLGVPNGDFFQYTWSDEATQGTWSQVATDLGDQLPTGDYNSLEPLDQLIGCDLNGTWQLEITDLWGGDAGELSEWFLTFDPTIIPDVTEFTPSIGEESDSTFWTFDTTNLDVQFESTDGNEIVAYPLEVGDYAFNYTVLNSHGCNYDSTLTITVEQPGLAEAGPDVTFCGGGDTQLLGGLQGQPPSSCVNDGGNHTFCYDNGTVQSLTYCPDNPGDGFTFIDITFNAGSTENFFDEFYVYDGDSDAAPLLAGPLFGDLSGMQFIATNPTGCLTISVDPDNSVSCTSGSQTEWNFDVSCGAGGPQFIYEWAPTDGLSDPNIATPYVTSLNGATTYTLTAYPEGHPDCVSTDTATVNPAFDFTMEANEPSCLGNDGFIDVWVDENSGPGPWTIEMTEAGMAPITEISLGGTTTFGGLFPGNYDVSIESGGCIYNQNFDILGAPPLTFETSNDTIICIGGIAPLAAWSDDDIDNSWTYTWDNGLGQGAAVNASPVVTTTYEVYTTDDFGCDSAPIQILVEVRDPITVEFVAPSELCAGADATLDVINTNGGSFAPYSYDWTFNGNTVGSGELFTNNEAITGEYCVLAYDGCETPPGEYCQTVEIEAAVPVAFEADTTMGCFPAVINFTNLSDPTLFVDQYWFYGDGNASEGADPSHIYENPGLYDVRLQLRSALGCLYDANYGNYIQVLNNPQVNFTASPQPTTIPETEITFFEEAESGLVEYEWIFNTGNPMGTSFEENPVFEFPIDVGGVYPVSLTVTDEFGCTATEEKFIIVNDLLNIYIPNSFTPNNDGINDLFYVSGTDIDPSRFTFQVFDRWGELVFETTDPEIGWDGSYQIVNKEYYAQDGLYSWRVVLYSTTTTERKEIIGHINLMR